MNILSFIRVNILRKFINLRVLSQNQIPYDEIIRIELLVAMCLVSFTLGISYILVGLFMDISLVSILNYLIFFFTTIPAVLYLTKRGYYNEAKLIMMLLGNIFMFIKASSMGPDSGMNLAMLIILFAIFAFYSISDYKYICAALFITLGSILFLELTDYSFLSHDPSTNKYEYEFNYISTIVFCIMFFYVILRVNHYNNGKLQKLNDNLLYKNRRLRKINDELDNYVYKASHDMRAPLTSLMGILNLVKVEKDPEVIKKLINMQEICISKLDNHISQIIDLSRNVKTELNNQQIDINAMIQEVFEELSFFENASQTKKIIRISESDKFFSDPYRLKMILNNLISNAFKYAAKDGRIAQIEIEVVITTTSATISINDNGVGIPVNQQDRIFDMFYRGTHLSKGSGLGLYIVKEMINRMNGSISVVSETKRFTNIIFVLPNGLLSI